MIENLKTALDTVEFMWRDVPMNEYAFHRLENLIIQLNECVNTIKNRETVAWMTHHDEPMIFLTRSEALDYCDYDEEPIPLYME